MGLYFRPILPVSFRPTSGQRPGLFPSSCEAALAVADLLTARCRPTWPAADLLVASSQAYTYSRLVDSQLLAYLWSAADLHVTDSQTYLWPASDLLVASCWLTYGQLQTYL